MSDSSQRSRPSKGSRNPCRRRPVDRCKHAGGDDGNARAHDGRDASADVKLDELVKGMNTATGEAKIYVMAKSSLTLRVRKTMHEHMGIMNQMMMPMMRGAGMMKK